MAKKTSKKPATKPKKPTSDSNTVARSMIDQIAARTEGREVVRKGRG